MPPRSISTPGLAKRTVWCGGIEDQIPVVDERPHGGEFLSRGLVGLLVVKSPQPNERADRHVETAPALRAHLLRRLQHAHHRIADANRLPRGVAIDERKLAVVAIVAHQPIDFRKGAEGLFNGGGSGFRRSAERLHLDRRAHDVAIRLRLVARLRKRRLDKRTRKNPHRHKTDLPPS